MKSYRTVLAAGLIAVASAQSVAFTDERSNITYQKFSSQETGMSFGWSLPSKANDTMMGLLTAPIKAGWVGLSFGGGMRNSLLLVAWNNNGNLTGDLRYATSYQLPKPYEGKTEPAMLPLACSSGYNDTHWFLAFACQNCHNWTNALGTAKGGFDLNAATTKFGWAYSDVAPANPDDPRSAISKHGEAGKFTANLNTARSESFDDWLDECSGAGEGADEAAPATKPVRM